MCSRTPRLLKCHCVRRRSALSLVLALRACVLASGGVNWANKPVPDGEEKSISGMTAGSSFQDYRLLSVDVVRNVMLFDCCPNSPYPALIYRIQFERSSDYYTFKLVLPAVILSMLSFITFWLNPVPSSNCNTPEATFHAHQASQTNQQQQSPRNQTKQAATTLTPAQNQETTKFPEQH